MVTAPAVELTSRRSRVGSGSIGKTRREVGDLEIGKGKISGKIELQSFTRTFGIHLAGIEGFRDEHVGGAARTLVVSVTVANGTSVPHPPVQPPRFRL